MTNSKRKARLHEEGKRRPPNKSMISLYGEFIPYFGKSKRDTIDDKKNVQVARSLRHLRDDKGKHVRALIRECAKCGGRDIYEPCPPCQRIFNTTGKWPKKPKAKLQKRRLEAVRGALAKLGA